MTYRRAEGKWTSEEYGGGDWAVEDIDGDGEVLIELEGDGKGNPADASLYMAASDARDFARAILAACGKEG